MQPVTALYVPGDRPDRFDKAAASGADLVILDLEDAVAPDAKDGARAAVVEWLRRRPSGPTIQVRVNTEWTADVSALDDVEHPIGLRVPKVESPDRLDGLPSWRPVTAIIESALGVENALEIARHPLVTRIALGEADLASDIDSTAELVMDYARTRLLFVARAAGLPAPMLSVFPAIQDLDGLRADTERGRSIGWFGRTAIHPSQLAVIREVFRSSPSEIAWAEEVVAAMSSGGVGTLASGEMVDPAMVGRARLILERSGEGEITTQG